MTMTRLTISLLALALVGASCGSDDAVPGTGEPTSTTVPVIASTSTVPATTTAAAGPVTYPLVDTGQTECYDDTDPIVCPGPGEAFG
jgi:ABC-type glycerol-3-phosphate transport system substrate-binding protein